MTEERFAPQPGFLWHYADPESSFRKLASEYGVTLPDDFHVDGWQRDLTDGTYKYG